MPLLPGAQERQETPHPRPVVYAPPPTNGGSLSSIAFACSISFVPGCVAAALFHPRIPEVLLGAVVALPLAGFVLGLIARRKGFDAAAKSRRRAKSAVVIGGFELGLVLIVGELLPHLCVTREPAKRVMCANNLREIGLAILQYSNDHGGRFPPTLILLLSDPNDGISANMLICPSTTDSLAPGNTPPQQAGALQTLPGHLSYVYVGSGLTNQATAATVLAYDNPHNHGDEGINVLYSDGHIEFLDEKRADQMRAELKAGHNPPRVR